MKKLTLLTLMPMLLAGCNKGTVPSNNDEYKKLKFVTPTGAPAIAMSGFCDLDGFETNNDPSNIIPMMVNGQVDVAVLPTNVGVNAIKRPDVKFKMLATITFGNFYIAATGNDNDDVMDEDDYIVSFQQNAVPDKVFHYIYGNTYDSAVHYVGSNALAATCLMSGKNASDDNKDVDYVVIAEPALTTILNKNPARSLYKSLTEEYKTKSGGLLLAQASVFVKSSLDKEKIINPLFDALSKSVNLMINKPAKVESNMNKVDNPAVIFGVEPSVAKEVTANGNRMGLGCKAASKIKNDINEFLGIFGVSEITNEDIAK